MAYDLTPQQVSFIDAVLRGERHVTLRARAGTGKTSTILATVAACAKQNHGERIMLCAYNKSIEVELSSRLRDMGIEPNVAFAKTAHAAGMGLITGTFGRVTVSDKKVGNILKIRDKVTVIETVGNVEQKRDVDFWNGGEQYLIDQFYSQICQLVGYAKNSGFGYFPDIDINADASWFAIADHFGVNGIEDDSQMRRVFAICRKAFAKSLSITQEIDFDDMILLPLIMKLKVRYPLDKVFVDEAQDLSRTRQELVKKFVKPGTGRLYIVGDDRQAIYGFSGADATALHRLTTELGALDLPLTVTWRCARSIVECANQYVPDLEYAEGAKDGEVSTISDLPADLKPGDAILCRFNAPLIEYAFRLIRSGIPAHVEGRDIGRGLAKLARRWKVRDIAGLLARLDDYKTNELRKAAERGSERKAQEVTDRVDTLVEICDAVVKKGRNSVDDVVAAIENLFGDDINPKQCVVLSSVHKAKGREWGRVVFLDKKVRRQLQEWQELQEENLRYVAITRAKHTFYFLPIVDEKKQQWS